MSALWLSLLLAVGPWASTGGLGARILGIFPTPSISHQLPFQAVMKALAAKGHEVTVISTDPLKIPQANYTDIDMSFAYDYFHKANDFNAFVSITPYQFIEVVKEFGHLTELQLSSDGIQSFIRSNPKFDLVFIECIAYQAYYGLIHHVGSPPIIGILSLGQIAVTNDLVTNPNNPSYDPELFLPYDNHMGLWQRLNNMVFGLWARHIWYSKIIPEQENILRKYFGNGPPAITETEKNFSLVMVNNHWTMSYPRPLMPNFIELGNLHLKSNTSVLPQDLALFLDGADDGFIYFSLGSNVRSDKLPLATRQHLLESFAELPQRVLWKWESEEMPGKPPNVRVCKWLPQTDILAHPKIRLFITQGGLQSLGEAVQHAVPMVGIPFMGDQAYNVQKIVSSGIGVKLDFLKATKENILKALRTVLNDSSYLDNVKKLSAVSKDQPETSLERAVWWTEYILRHKGAPHLRSAALDLGWYQYLLLDVYAFLAVILLAIALLLRVFIKLSKSLLLWSTRTKSKND